MENLNKLLPLMGHRNWIAIVDSAYPLQCCQGIETIVSNKDQLAEVRDTLGASTTPLIFVPKSCWMPNCPISPRRNPPASPPTVTRFPICSRSGRFDAATRQDHRSNG